jgi:hypothetical protein
MLPIGVAPSMNISTEISMYLSIAFADDNAKELQNQLTIIYKFLDGPEKSKIITNLSEAETYLVKEKQTNQ